MTEFPDVTIRYTEECLWIEAGEARIPLRFDFVSRFASLLDVMASQTQQFVKADIDEEMK